MHTTGPIQRGFITRIKPINGITPFTYRDGITYLQVLEALRAYIRDVLVDEFNRVIADINEQGEAMAVEFDQLIADTNDAIDVLLVDFTDQYEQLEQLVSTQINAVNTLISELEEYYDTTDQLLTDKIDDLNTKISEVDDQLEIIDNRLDLIEWLTPGPKPQHVELTAGSNTVEINPVWNGWPIEYILTQPTTGNGTAEFDPPVDGLKLKTGPGAVTRMRLLPTGENSWVVDPYYGLVHNGLTYDVKAESRHRRTLDSDGAYNAFVSAVTGDDGTVLMGYAKYTNHYGGGIGVTLKYSRDGGQTFQLATIVRPDENATSWAVAGLATMGGRYAALLNHNDPRRMYIAISNNAEDWSTPVQFGTGFPSSLTWLDNGTEDGVMLATSYSTSGVFVYQSYDLGVTWTTLHNLPQPPASADFPYSETHIVRSGDQLIMGIRYEPNGSVGPTNQFMVSRSYDMGATWTPPQMKVDDVTGHPRLTVLPNGDIVTPFRSRKPGSVFEGWAYGISTDNGHTWQYRDIRGFRQMYGEFTVSPNGEVRLYGSYELDSGRAHVFSAPVEPTIGTVGAGDTGWVGVSFPSSYTNVGVAYRVINDIVYWRGTLINNSGQFGTSWTHLVTLPQIARPPHRIAHSVGATQTTLARGLVVEITASGDLSVAQSGEESYDQVNFYQIPPYPRTN